MSVLATYAFVSVLATYASVSVKDIDAFTSLLDTACFHVGFWCFRVGSYPQSDNSHTINAAFINDIL